MNVGVTMLPLSEDMETGGSSQISSRGPRGGGAGEGSSGGVVMQPQAACVTHPGAGVSWNPAPAARQRLI